MTSTSLRFGLALGLLGLSFSHAACGDDGTPSQETSATETDTSSSSDTEDDGESSDDTSSSTTTPSSSTTTSSNTTTSSSSTGSSSSSDSSSDSTSDTSTGACAANFHCLDVPADGWEGPVARIEVESATGVDEIGACRAPFPYQNDTVWANPSAQQHSCECKCGKGTGMECSEAEAIFSDKDDCSTIVASRAIGACGNIPEKGASAKYVRVKAPEVKANTGSCPPIGPNLTASDEPVWTLGQRTCGPFKPKACVGEEGICVPEPTDVYVPGVCIWKEGENECPAGDYSERILRYRNVEDQRTCGDCTCGAPDVSVLSCKAIVELYWGDSCTGNTKESVTDFGTCGPIFANPTVPNSAKLGDNTEIVGKANCTPGGGAPTGGPVATDAVTYCCAAL